MSLRFSDYEIEVPALSLVILGFFAAMIVVSIIAMVRIVQRAGYNGWWILIIFVPIANMLALWYFGFGPWPASITSQSEK
jgi:hypothetical protein